MSSARGFFPPRKRPKPQPEPLARLSEEFERLASLCSGPETTFRALLGSMTPREHGLLTLLLCVLFASQVPLLGLSIPFGAMVAMAGGRMALGKGPWIPRRLLDRRLPSTLFRLSFHSMAVLLRPLERWVRPRGRFLTEHPGVRRLNGAALALAGALLMPPLPPPLGLPPALAGLMLSVGIIEDDILFIASGWAALLFSIGAMTLFAMYGFAGVELLRARWG